MTTSAKGPFRASAFLSVTLAFAGLGLTAVPGLHGAEASAQTRISGKHVSGGSRKFRQGVFNNRRLFTRNSARVIPVYRDPALQRIGLRSTNTLSTSVRRSGVVLRGRNRLNRRNADLVNRGDLLFVERRRRIEAYNRSLNRNRAGVTFNGPVVVRAGRQGIITSAYDGGVAGPVVRHTTPCPAGHNCGYRYYEDGTGPRIIIVGQSAGRDLPPYDGLSGPKVITLEEIN